MTTCERILQCFRDGYQKDGGVHSRLKGRCGERIMSVEDQVQFTIHQATCNDGMIH